MLKERIERPKIMDPREIEAISMEIIEPYLAEFQFGPGEKDIYKRIIHTTGDPSIASQIRLSSGFVRTTTFALKSKCTIVTDVEMVRAGINKYNLSISDNNVVCGIHDPVVADLAKKSGTTRAVAAVNYLASEIEQSLFVVGNAPTALYEILRLVIEEGLRPATIIGVPVGFVGAKESKDLLISLAPRLAELKIAWISLQGTKGGSTIAASIINALLIQSIRGNQND